MKQLTSKQCKYLLIFYVCLNKIMLLPSIICSSASNSFWLVLLLMFGFEFLFILMILSISKQNPDLTLKQRIEDTFGTVFTKIIYFLIGLLLLFKLCIAIHECYIYLFDSLYANYSWFEMLLPLGLYLFYIGIKSFTNLGRCCEIVKYIIFACIAISLFDALPNTELLSLFPLFNTSMPRILNSGFSITLWFGDFILLFFMIGDIKVNKNINKDILSGYFIGVAITVVTISFFYLTYGIIAPLRRMAVIDITQFVSKLSISSNFSWIVTSSWIVAVAFNLGLLMYLTNKSFAICFGVKDIYRKQLSFIVVIGVFVVLVVFNFRINNMMKFLNGYFKYYVFCVQYILPLIILPISAIKSSKNQSKRRLEYVK